jgi:acetyl esterase/lipase
MSSNRVLNGAEPMTRVFLCVAACLLANLSPTRADDPIDQIASRLEPTRKLAYKRAGERDLYLHVFDPADSRPGDQRPCFIVIHGGGWTGGAPRRMYPFAEHFARQGLVGISVEYRLLNTKLGTTVFDCVKDGRSAVRYVRSHAAELGIDPQKIVVSGGSAGGHVAAATAIFDGIDEAGEATEVSCVPNALVLLFPVIDTSPAGYGTAKIGERWQELSPAHRVRPGAPPTIVFHGTADTVTPFAGAVAFRDAMAKAGNRCELVSHEGGRHGYLMFDRELYLQTLRQTEVFLTSLVMTIKADDR